MKLEILSHFFKLIDKSFKEELSSTYHLSFILSLSGFAFCILDLKQNRLIFLEEHVFQKQPNNELLCNQVKSFISQSPILNAKFKSVSVGIYNEIVTLVPSALFDERKKKEFLQFNFSGDSFSAANDFLQEIDSHTIYDAPEIITKTFKELYNKAGIIHFSSSLIESLAIENKYKTDLNFYLHFFQKNPYGAVSRFEIIIFRAGKMLFFNSFQFQEKEDIAYYVLFVLEQLNLNPETTSVTILGNIQKTDEAVELLNNYVKAVEFGNHPGNFEYSSDFDELPSHFYYALLSQYLFA